MDTLFNVFKWFVGCVLTVIMVLLMFALLKLFGYHGEFLFIPGVMLPINWALFRKKRK